MSDTLYQPDHKPLISDSVLTYFGVVGAVAIAIAVFLGAIYASTPDETQGVSETLKAQRVAKRLEVEGAGHQLLAGYGKSASTPGTFRIPADKAAEILVTNPAALDAARGVSNAK